MSDDEYDFFRYDQRPLKILDRRLIGKNVQYLVLWGSFFGKFEPFKSWTSEEALKDYSKMIDDFLNEHFIIECTK